MVKMGSGEQMKQKFLLVISILVIVTLSACGAEATPTISAADIASTAMADAWIAVTQTQAAMPTNTPIPPTFTPQPTFTFVPTQPILPTLTPAVVAAATQDECNQVPIEKPQGAQVRVKFVNKSEGLVNLSFGMNSPNSKGECVTYSYTIGVFEEPVVTVLVGCYWGYAWITGDEPSVARTGSTILCVDDPNKVPPIWITKETIYFH
jgi:hypothetical protein